MKDNLIALLNSYLILFPEEQERQKILIQYLQSHQNDEVVDWNNLMGILLQADLFMQKKKINF